MITNFKFYFIFLTLFVSHRIIAQVECAQFFRSLDLIDWRGRRVVEQNISWASLRRAGQLYIRYQEIEKMIRQGRVFDLDDSLYRLDTERDRLHPLISPYEALMRELETRHELTLQTRFADRSQLQEALERLERGESSGHPVIENNELLADADLLSDVQRAVRQLQRALNVVESGIREGAFELPMNGSNRAIRGFGRLSHEARVAVLRWLERIVTNPREGKIKVSFPSYVRFIGFTQGGVHYRIAYTLLSNDQIRIEAIGPHENFYALVDDLR